MSVPQISQAMKAGAFADLYFYYFYFSTKQMAGGPETTLKPDRRTTEKHSDRH